MEKKRQASNILIKRNKSIKNINSMCMNEEQYLQCKMSLIKVYESNADGHCSHPNDALAPSELNCSDCQQHRDKMRQYWHRMDGQE